MRKTPHFKLKSCLILLILLSISLSIFSQIPPDYYKSIDGQRGDSLKSALNDIIDGHIEYSYNTAWDILKDLDRDPENSANVIGFFSRFSMDADEEYDGGDGWTREHIWPRSKGDFSTNKGVGTDLHNLVVADASTNSSKNNRSFDEGGSLYLDQDGNYQGLTPSKIGYNWTWEPGDEQKGDVARMMFYMATRYEGENGEPDLELTDEILSKDDRSPLHGRLSVLLNWHVQDSVSEYEKVRQEAIYDLQANRNPFIDHPEYADMIWKVLKEPAAFLFFSEYIEGSSFNKALEIANLSGWAIDLSEYSIKKKTNGAATWSTGLALEGMLPHGRAYGIVHHSADSSLIDFADLITNSAVLNFNGNDPIGLFRKGSLIDIIGKEETGGAYFAKDITLTRKVAAPNAVFTIQEWDSLGKNAFTDFGLIGTILLAEGNPVSNLEDITSYLKQDYARLITFPNPSQGQLTILATNMRSVALFDLLGRKIPSEITYLNEEVHLRAHHLGIAILEVETVHGKLKRKIIFQ